MAKFAPNPEIHITVMGKDIKPHTKFHGYRFVGGIRRPEEQTWTKESGVAGPNGANHDYEFIIDRQFNEDGEICP